MKKQNGNYMQFSVKYSNNVRGTICADTMGEAVSDAIYYCETGKQFYREKPTIVWLFNKTKLNKIFTKHNSNI